MTKNGKTLPAIIAKDEDDLLTDWMKEQKSTVGRVRKIKDAELRDQSKEFLKRHLVPPHDRNS